MNGKAAAEPPAASRMKLTAANTPTAAIRSPIRLRDIARHRRRKRGGIHGREDVFVHASALERSGLGTLVEGQRVSFDIQTDRRTGKTSAGNLQLA